ncbi:MAG: helix-turn-helix transcriptional regulator [Anaerolineales bacterium]|nr:helix-turn-helix transcriptional regulator [Anaerolineales bacterium]
MNLFDKEALSIDVASCLRELRKEREMSMRALAQRSGLSANALSMIERGKTSPSVTPISPGRSGLASIPPAERLVSGRKPVKICDLAAGILASFKA